ncbi:MAG: class I SAM-dependent methyltransferase [Methanothrix sp.]|uniref:class I SAM-dependent methyltransferase n=1 Tax=Methanothrix sp. TaxID=90426 RepID=UPI003C76F938
MIDNEGVRAVKAERCMLCGSEGMVLYSNLHDRLFGAPGVWSLMECPACQLVWLNPRPISEDIGKLYCQYFTHQVVEAPSGALSGLKKSVKESVLRSGFGYPIDGSHTIMGQVLGRIGPLREIVGGGVMWLRGEERGRLLDVGCGNGMFLDRMRQLGWEVAGVEPDAAAVAVAREMLGLEVFQGLLEDAKFPDGHFDAITMNHVIEHVPDPIGTLKACQRVLRPGGKLVVVTPNIESLGRRKFDDAWLHWDPPRHLHIFSPQSLRLAAERAGLRVQEMRTTARTARWIYAASSCIRRDGSLPGGSPGRAGVRMRLQGLAFQAIEHARGGGEEIVMVAGRR